MPDFYFNTYAEWRDALQVRCGIRMTAEYARERIAALQNDAKRSTAEFVRCYGEAYRQQVIDWFKQAEREGG